MNLAAGLLANSPVACEVAGALLVQFRLSPDLLDEVSLLDSTYAAPGRYAGEILRRLRQAYPDAARYLAINPYLDVTAPLAARLVENAASQRMAAADQFLVLTGKRRPLAYLFSAAAVDRCPPIHLGLLSCTDPALDERFLHASLGCGRVVALGGAAVGPLASDGGNGFFRLSPAVAQATRRAAQLLESLPSDAARQEMVQRGERAAVVGYHAGDVLFWAQALHLAPTLFRSAVVLSAYADVFQWLAPDVACLPVHGPLPHRPGHHVTDDLALLWEYVVQLEEHGTAPRLWHLLRPFRDYSRARHHLREAMAFALGEPGHPIRPPPPFEPALRERRLSQPRSGRVIVHFEGGWPLKEFPPSRRGELLSLLRVSGYEPIILGRPEPAAPEVAAVPYTDLASFRVLLSTAEAMVGCDSFPAHFTQTLGVPTVQSFGSTHPDSSRGVESPGYRYLHHPMPCVPCNEIRACRLDGGQSCRAHPTSHEVLDAVRALLPAGETRRPRSTADIERLLAGDAAAIAFPARPALAPAARERFLDRLFGRLALEAVEACPLCGGRAHREIGTKFRLPVAVCEKCGLWLVTRRIAERDLPAFYGEPYWTEFPRLHGEPTHVERYAFDYVAALGRARDLLDVVPAGRTVLDVGCALGAVPRRLGECGYRGIGLEVDAELARKALLLSTVTVYTSLDDVRRSEEPLGGVVMYDVFEHFYHPVEMLQSLRGLMAADGVLVVETFRTDSPAFQREGLEHEDVEPIEHPYMYRAEHVHAILRRAGFAPFRVGYPEGEDSARIRIAARRDDGAGDAGGAPGARA